MLKIGESGWIEKERPKCGPMDAICRPLAVAICTSDVHTLWEGAIGDRHNMILGHECCAEVVEVGELVKDFKPGDRVLVPAITPDWNSLEAQAGYSMHSGGMLAGWKFSNFKDGVFSEFFHVNDADGNLALLPKNINVVDACRVYTIEIRKLKVESVSDMMRNKAVFLSPSVSNSNSSYMVRSRSSWMSNGASLAPQEMRMDFAVLPAASL